MNNEEKPFEIGDLVRLRAIGSEITITSMRQQDNGCWLVEGEEIHTQARVTTLHINLEYIPVEQIQLLGTWEQLELTS